MERRDFLKLGGAAAIFYFLESCGIRAEQKPFILSPERTDVGPGFAVADFSSTATDVYLPFNDVGGGDAETVFSSSNKTTSGMEHLLGDQSFHSAPDWWKLVDHSAVKDITGGRVILTDIRFNQNDPVLIRVIGEAPQIKGTKPEEGISWQPAVFSLAAQSGGKWLDTLASYGNPDVSAHMVGILKGVGSRIRLPDMLTPDDVIFAGAIVPRRYAKDMTSELSLDKGLVNAVNAVRDLSNVEGVPVAEELYVNTYDATGRINPSLRLPMGCKVGISALHQLKDGRVLALIVPRRETVLTGYTPGDDGLIMDATKYDRMPIDPVWVDVMEFWTDPGSVGESVQKQEFVAQATKQDVVATKRAAFPSPTGRASPSPEPTKTPQPTATATATATDPPSYTGWQPTTEWLPAAPSLPAPPPEATLPVVTQTDTLSEILIWANIIGWSGLLGFLGWKVGGSAYRIAKEEKRREEEAIRASQPAENPAPPASPGQK